MYPKIEINVKGILDNFKIAQQRCDENHITLSLVTKLLAGNVMIVKKLVESGVHMICDSRIQNLMKFKDLKAEKWLIRMPNLSEIKEVILYADVSFNTELKTLKALNEEAIRQNKTHQVILMYELGDLREGCLKEELKHLVKECLLLPNLKLIGIATNLSCYGEILPTPQNMEELAQTFYEIENEMDIKFTYLSGGNSSSYRMLETGLLSHKINHLRFGESIFLGRIPCLEEEIENMHHDNFVLKAQIIELKEKPSLPWGETGNCNSFGEQVSFIDKGIRKRAIIGIGRQDINHTSLIPFDDKIEILSGSSDHIILDVTDSERNYQVGDVLSFHLNYSGILQLMTSEYVEKEIHS